MHQESAVCLTALMREQYSWTVPISLLKHFSIHFCKRYGSSASHSSISSNDHLYAYRRSVTQMAFGRKLQLWNQLLLLVVRTLSPFITGDHSKCFIQLGLVEGKRRMMFNGLFRLKTFDGPRVLKRPSVTLLWTSLFKQCEVEEHFDESIDELIDPWRCYDLIRSSHCPQLWILRSIIVSLSFCLIK